MTTNTRTTLIYVGVAVVLAILAVVTEPRVSRDPAVFDDTGEAFYPGLTDPTVPTALEVVGYDEELREPDIFRVQFQDGQWTIPSHHDYPADAEQRLAQTAGSIIGLRKDTVVSDSQEDHEAMGVVDPLNATVGQEGQGTRIKLFDKSNNTVSDLIVGKEVEGKPGFRYVRVPSRDRVYAVRTDGLELSTRFSDWIAPDLLTVSSGDVESITVDNAKPVVLPNGTIGLRQGPKIELAQKEGDWTLADLSADQKTNQEAAGSLASAIAGLRIVGVREKPQELKQFLSNPLARQFVLQSMVQRGFFPLANGKMASDDGSVTIETNDGIVYTLQLGGVLVDTGEGLTAGGKDEQAKVKTQTKATKDAKAKKDEPPRGKEKPLDVEESRFVLVSVSFDESKYPPIKAPKKAKAMPAAESKGEAEAGKRADKAVAKKNADTKETDAADDKEAKKAEEELAARRKQREETIAAMKKRVDELQQRYGTFYYLVPNDATKQIHVARADLIEKPEPGKDATSKNTNPVMPARPKGATPRETSKTTTSTKPQGKATKAETKKEATKAIAKPKAVESKGKPKTEEKAAAKTVKKAEPKKSPKAKAMPKAKKSAAALPAKKKTKPQEKAETEKAGNQ